MTSDSERNPEETVASLLHWLLHNNSWKLQFFQAIKCLALQILHRQQKSPPCLWAAVSVIETLHYQAF